MHKSNRNMLLILLQALVLSCTSTCCQKASSPKAFFSHLPSSIQKITFSPKQKIAIYIGIGTLAVFTLKKLYDSLAVHKNNKFKKPFLQKDHLYSQSFLDQKNCIEINFNNSILSIVLNKKTIFTKKDSHADFSSDLTDQYVIFNKKDDIEIKFPEYEKKSVNKSLLPNKILININNKIIKDWREKWYIESITLSPTILRIDWELEHPPTIPKNIIIEDGTSQTRSVETAYNRLPIVLDLSSGDYFYIQKNNLQEIPVQLKNLKKVYLRDIRISSNKLPALIKSINKIIHNIETFLAKLEEADHLSFYVKNFFIECYWIILKPLTKNKFSKYRDMVKNYTKIPDIPLTTSEYFSKAHEAILSSLNPDSLQIDLNDSNKQITFKEYFIKKQEEYFATNGIQKENRYIALDSSCFILSKIFRRFLALVLKLA